jgi:redox-sensitive bicupin YhaK (pirin superfamily)
MSNLEERPAELTCEPAPAAAVEILAPRDVPLGGPRAMRVRRTLPQRHRSLIGAWCFVDHYGPDDVTATAGMSVAPHPHTGLQTVSWLFTGEIEHRDSAGHHARVRPGEVNLMTAGRGISHSEVSTPEARSLHGAQLWVALPDADRDTDPGFDHHTPTPVAAAGWEARVFLGSLLGSTSPVPTYSPLVGAELLLEAGTALTLDVDPAFEHGVLVDTGVLAVAGTEVKQHELAYVPVGTDRLRLTAYDVPVRLLLLGGTPFGEAIVMWWNFVGRSHDEIVGFRRQWQEQITADGAVVADSQQVSAGRFGVVPDDHLPPIPAPPLPNGRLKERR